MRVVVSALDSPSIPDLVLDGRGIMPQPVDYGVVLGLASQGLEGWFDSLTPSLTMEGAPGLDGAFGPATTKLESRVLTIRGVHRVIPGLGSAVTVETFRDRLAQLTGEHVKVLVDGNVGERYVTGWVSDQVTVDHTAWNTTRFSLIVTCPDPFKYGPDVTRARTGAGTVVVSNLGTAPVYPTIEADSVTALTVASGNRTVTWTGTSATNLSIDLRTMIPVNRATGKAAGMVSLAPAPVINPGDQTVTLTPTPSTANVRVTAASAWR